MKTKIVTTTLIVMGLAAPVQAQDFLVHRQENQSDKIYNQLIADAAARQQNRQERQEQRQQNRQERQEQRQQNRQERQEQRQQNRQERQEQRQQNRQERLQSEQNLQQHPSSDNWQQPYQDSWWNQNPGQYSYPRTTVEDSSDVPPVVKQIKVDLVSQTQDKVTVLIEGENDKQKLVFNTNKTSQTVYLAPGKYNLSFNNDLGSSWASINLEIKESNPVRITFQKDNPLIQVNNSCKTNTDRDCSK